MKLSDFDYPLPEELIAYYPPEKRGTSKLLHLDKKSGALAHYSFHQIDQFFVPGDVLVLNNTKVVPARLIGSRSSGGKVEALLLKDLTNGEWEVLLKPGKRVRKGDKLSFGNEKDRVEAEALEGPEEGKAHRRLKFSEPNMPAVLERIGRMPLPPYIKREHEPTDFDRYQTIYAKNPGAVAAPTAGLHFDAALLERLKAKGVEICYVTLHVSYGTFQTVYFEDLSQHVMFEEEMEIEDKTAKAINQAKSEGRRIIACGTTSVRALESSVDSKGSLIAQKKATRLFVYPPYEFKIASGLITNFHLPKSTLLLLVSAFWGGLDLLKVYQEAIKQKYRFYSYGDAMLIL